jgi:hypothetical protein
MIMTEYFYVCIGLRQHKWMTSPLSFSLYWFIVCIIIIPIKIYNNNNNNNNNVEQKGTANSSWNASESTLCLQTQRPNCSSAMKNETSFAMTTVFKQI